MSLKKEEQENSNEKKNENNNEYLITCKICLSNRINLIFTPCYHACICQECWNKLSVPKLCPICRCFVISTLYLIIDN